jgi:DNA-binding MarR family transcriptional regulator
MSGDDAIESIHAELSAIARRVRGRAQELHPDLSFVAYTLLAHVRARGGCRASELVRFYGLEKSTVSRQVAALERRRLVERVYDPADRRIQTLRLTAEGTTKLRVADAAFGEALARRVADWPAADVEQFAALLRRFNEAPV